jgi:hypothetical protein
MSAARLGKIHDRCPSLDLLAEPLERVRRADVAAVRRPGLAGVGPSAREVLARTGLLAQFGEPNVLPSDPHVDATLDAGLGRGRALPSELEAPRSSALPSAR